MVELAALAQAILGFVAIVCVGVAMRASGLVSRADVRPLNLVIIYVGLPAFVFRSVHGARVGAAEFTSVGVAWVVFGILLAVAALAVRALRLERTRSGAFLLASSLGNTGYIGYPLTSALLGPAALPAAVFYDVFGTVMQLVLVGLPISKRFGTAEVRHRPLGALGELLAFPAFVAAVAALLLSSVPVPKPVSDWLGLLASMVAPLIMLTIGISLRPKAIFHGAAALGVLAAIRLVLAPAIAGIAGGFALSEPMALRSSVLEAGMPSMMLTLAIGERYGLDEDFIAAAIFVTTIASAVTVPLAQLMLG